MMNENAKLYRTQTSDSCQVVFVIKHMEERSPCVSFTKTTRYLSLTISILHRGADTLHTSDLNDDYLTQTHRYLKVERSSDPSDLSPASFSFREQLPYLP